MSIIERASEKQRTQGNDDPTNMSFFRKHLPTVFVAIFLAALGRGLIAWRDISVLRDGVGRNAEDIAAIRDGPHHELDILHDGIEDNADAIESIRRWREGDFFNGQRYTRRDGDEEKRARKEADRGILEEVQEIKAEVLEFRRYREDHKAESSRYIEMIEQMKRGGR